MDIIDRLLELSLKDNVYEVISKLLSNNATLISEAKKTLREQCGIIFVQVMQNTKVNCMIMIKTKNTSFIYEYNKLTEELNMKGERKIANIK